MPHDRVVERGTALEFARAQGLEELSSIAQPTKALRLYTRNPKPSTLHPNPYTLNPKT
jgi:hypothetical protein